MSEPRFRTNVPTRRRSGALTCLTLGLVVLAGNAGTLRADLIPYPSSGTYNATTYTFTATSTGDVTAYYAGSDASYENKIGLLINGVLSSNGYGLDDHTSTIGQTFDLGAVKAGDKLTFVLENISLGANAYSDPSLNVPYDSPGETIGHNHIYSAAYTATSPIYNGIPKGTYVAFEDEAFPASDFSYADENFVFTNVTMATGVPEPGPAALALVALAGLAARHGARRRKPAAE